MEEYPNPTTRWLHYDVEIDGRGAESYAGPNGRFY